MRVRRGPCCAFVMPGLTRHPPSFLWQKEQDRPRIKSGVTIGTVMSDYETIVVYVSGPIARITLNRPDRLNSFTAAMHGELKDALGRLGDARVVILTGAGRGFCAG